MTDLLNFLSEAQVSHYHQKFLKNLKVTNLAQLRYVEDEDMVDIGMSRAEITRLKLHLRKKFPNGKMGQLKKFFGKGRENRCERSNSLRESQTSLAAQYDKSAISKHAVELSHLLGTGRFGSTVQLGTWTKDDHTQVQVAVKCLPKSRLQKPVSDFLQEISALYKVSHPHLAPIFGAILDIDSVLLVMEHAPLQSLSECLKDASLRTSLSVRLLCDLAIQVVDGMTYLEQQQIVHGNLAARNILVISIYQVKITDFGICGAVGVDRSVVDDSSNEELGLILPWCAPECAASLVFTSASDVWSFGATLWEMFSYGTQPWSELDCQQILKAVSPPSNRRLPLPKSCPDDWYGEMMNCWQFEPKDRPKFSELFASLSKMKLSRVVIKKDEIHPGCVQCKKSDIITVLSKSPEKPPEPGLWLGVVDATNEVGFFNPGNTSPHIEIITSDVNLLRNNPKINRSWSLRASLRPSSRKLTPSMISMPQNDMRHLGHVGFDGVVIGDVPFLSSNRSPSIGSGLSDLDTRPSVSSLSSLSGNGNKGSLLKCSQFGNSVSSSSIFTGPRQMDFSKDEADTCNFSDLKLPDLSITSSKVNHSEVPLVHKSPREDELNFGGSLFDEVMSALNVALSSRGVPIEGSTTAKDEASVQGNNITTSSSDSTIVAESHSGHPSDSEDDYHHNKLSSSLGSEVSEGREQLARGQTKFTSSAYGVYSIQNATRSREQVVSPLVVYDCEENSGTEASVTLPSEPNSIASNTSTEFMYVNAPVSRFGHVQSHDKNAFDDGLYLKPRKITQF